MGKKHTGVCVTNSFEIHLLHDCEDLVSMQHKLVSDVIDGMQTNLSRENPLFGKLSENFDDPTSTLRSPKCFEIPSPLLNSIRFGGILQ